MATPTAKEMIDAIKVALGRDRNPDLMAIDIAVIAHGWISLAVREAMAEQAAAIAKVFGGKEAA